MDRAANVLFGMIDNFVRVLGIQATKGCRFIGIENRTRFDVAPNLCLKRLASLIGYASRSNLAVSCEQAEDHGLPNIPRTAM